MGAVSKITLSQLARREAALLPRRVPKTLAQPGPRQTWGGGGGLRTGTLGGPSRQFSAACALKVRSRWRFSFGSETAAAVSRGGAR